jgi:hypothetical protein
MFEQLGSIFRKKTADTLILAYAGVPSWLEEHEMQVSAGLADAARRHVEDVSPIIERLRQTLKALQEKETAAGDDAPPGVVVRDSLVPFTRQVADPLASGLPPDICRFFADAEVIFSTCNEALAGYGQALTGAFPVEISAMREDTHALGRALLAARVPIIEKCRAKRQMIANVKAVLAKITEAEQDASGIADRISWIEGQVGEISQDLGRIRSEQETLASDPEPFLEERQKTHDTLSAQREEMKKTYTARADTVSALMLWARTIAKEKNDTYGSDVLLELIQLLTATEVPNEEVLMPALACAFEIVLDMVESGSLVPGNDEAAEILREPAEFNRDLCRICRDYADVNTRLSQVLPGPGAVAQRIGELKHEEARLEAQIRDYETAERDLDMQRMLAARQQWSLKKPLEDAVGELVGTPVQIRLNGEVFQKPKQS